MWQFGAMSDAGCNSALARASIWTRLQIPPGQDRPVTEPEQITGKGHRHIPGHGKSIRETFEMHPVPLCHSEKHAFDQDFYTEMRSVRLDMKHALLICIVSYHLECNFVCYIC